jgi:cobalt/nickel transport system permease protein
MIPSQTVRPRRAPRNPDLIERTLANLSHSVEQSLFAEGIAHQPGLFQRLDPRLKIAVTLAFLLAVGLSHSLAVILGLYAILVVLAWRSAVPVGFFIKRVWLFMPFFTALIAIPALFLTPGPALVTLPLGIVITRTGAISALFLLLRVGTSVSMAVLLILTTPWNTLLKALGVLRIPDVVVLLLGMTYRYIYLFIHLANDLFLARKSRRVSRLSGKAGRELVASSAGVLLTRSLDLSSEVYLAMQSRGFRGVPRTLDHFRMRTLDWVFGAGALLMCAAAIWLGR